LPSHLMSSHCSSLETGSTFQQKLLIFFILHSCWLLLYASIQHRDYRTAHKTIQARVYNSFGLLSEEYVIGKSFSIQLDWELN
jgi:hypothetical protein